MYSIAQANTVSIHDLHRYARYAPGRNHYDKGRNEDSKRDERRLILSAECQVGKTGAYLHYLKLLTRAASIIAVPTPLPPEEGSSPRDVVSWLLPYWRTLYKEKSLNRMYGILFASKYTSGVAKKRAYLVVQSCKREGWVVNYQRSLLKVVHDFVSDEGAKIKVFGETITSEAGETLITELGKELSGKDAPFDRQGQPKGTMASYESLKTAIDWDGRFHSHGVRLCVCNDQCTPECQAAMAKDSYGTVLPTIRMADLAETGGERDGDSARWEALQEAHRHDSDGEKRANMSSLWWIRGRNVFRSIDAASLL